MVKLISIFLKNFFTLIHLNKLSNGNNRWEKIKDIKYILI